MVLEFEEKKKYFTDVIIKDPILAHIQTQTHTIRGNVHVRQGGRLSDEINHADQFIAITQAEIYHPDGTILQTCDFMVVNRDHIVWIVPVGEENRDLKNNPETP
jgi:hypothetical protein